MLWWYAVWYGSIDATPATQLLSNPQLRFVGTAPSTGRPGWSNKGYTPGTTRTSTCQGSGRSLVRLLATLSTVGWSVAGAPVWAREHLVGLCTEYLFGFWSACPPSVCPAPEGLLGLCFESLGRGRHVPAPGGRDVGSNARAPTRETVQGTDPRNGFLLCRYPHGVLWWSLRRVVRCQPARGGYDVLGGTSPCSRCPSLVWRHCLRGG